MGTKEYNSGDGRGWEALGEQVDDENPSGDEEDSSRGVEGEAVVGG